MKCSGCGRVVMLDRVEFLRRRKKVLVQGPDSEEETLGLGARPAEEGDTLDNG